MFVKVGINMREAVRAAVDAGVDGVTAINTVPAMKIDADTGKPLFKNGRYGLSGPPIRPIALNEVYHIAAGYGTLVIGCGGVSSGEDALAFMQAGACGAGGQRRDGRARNIGPHRRRPGISSARLWICL